MVMERLQAALVSTYRIERELGGGGMSRVFVATERALDRPVVLKILPPSSPKRSPSSVFIRRIGAVAMWTRGVPSIGRSTSTPPSPTRPSCCAKRGVGRMCRVSSGPTASCAAFRIA